MCLTSYEGARVYMNRLDHIFEFGETQAPNSHVFLKYILDINGMMRKPLEMPAVRVRAEQAVFKRTTLLRFHVMDVYNKAQKEYKDAVII
jgi:hypothetical protein